MEEGSGFASTATIVPVAVESSAVESLEFRVAREGAPVRRLRLTGNRYTFGSAEGCSIRLNDPDLRPMHAVLIRDQGQVLVRAYSVPVEVNGSRVTESTLEVGDRLRLGEYEFELLSLTRCDSPEAFKAETFKHDQRNEHDDRRANDRRLGKRRLESRRSVDEGVEDTDEVVWRTRLRKEIDQWRGRQVECDQREHRCDEREAHLRGRESELWSRAENLYRREAQLQGQESAVHELHDEYAQRQEELLKLRDESTGQVRLHRQREAEFVHQEHEYHRQLEEATAHLLQSQAQAQEATESVGQMRQQFDALNQQIDELSSQQQTLKLHEENERTENQNLRGELELQRDQAIDAQAEGEARRREAETRIEEMAAELESIRYDEGSQVQAQASKLQESESTIVALSEKIETLQATVDAASDEASQVRGDYRDALDSVRQLEKLVEQSNQRGDRDREEWSLEADSLRSEMERLSADLDQAGTDLKDLKDANESLNSRLDLVRQERDDAIEEVDQRPTREAFDHLREELKTAQQSLDSLQQDAGSHQPSLAFTSPGAEADVEVGQPAISSADDGDMPASTMPTLPEACVESDVEDPTASVWDLQAPEAIVSSEDRGQLNPGQSNPGQSDIEQDSVSSADTSVDNTSVDNTSVDNVDATEAGGKSGESPDGLSLSSWADVDAVENESTESSESNEDVWPTYQMTDAPSMIEDADVQQEEVLHTEESVEASSWDQEDLSTSSSLMGNDDASDTSDEPSLASQLIADLDATGSDSLVDDAVDDERSASESAMDETFNRDQGTFMMPPLEEAAHETDDGSVDASMAWDREYPEESQSSSEDEDVEDESVGDRDESKSLIDDAPEFVSSTVEPLSGDAGNVDATAMMPELEKVEPQELSSLGLSEPEPAELKLPEPAAASPVPIADPVAVSPSSLGDDENEEDSIEAYMNRLLNRSHGVPGAPEAPAPESLSLSTASSEMESPVQDISGDSSAPISSDPPIDPGAPLVPRSHAPERDSDLSAMRELANQSARSAINRSSLIQTRNLQMAGMVNFAVAGVAGVIAIGLSFWLGGGLLLLSWAMLAIIAAISIRDGLRNMNDARNRARAAKKVKQEEASGA